MGWLVNLRKCDPSPDARIGASLTLIRNIESSWSLAKVME